MRLRVTWPAGAAPTIGEAEDAPPDPMAPHIERSLERGLPAGAQVENKLTRISRRGHPYWMIVSMSGGVPTVHASLLFIDLVIAVTVAGDVDAIIAALDDADIDFSEDVASLHQLFQESSS